jgi:hypothetical protein
MRTRIFLSIAFAILSLVGVRAQSPREVQASKLLSESKWAEAETAYAQIVSEQPKNATAWINLGESQLQQKKYDAAEKSFAQALELKFRPVVNRMNLARVAAARGDKEKLLARLRELVAAGLGSRGRPMLAYPEFTPFQQDADFKKIVSEDMAPCRAPHYRDFDFWIGEWQVYDPHEKQLLGQSSVTPEQEGCLIRENWKSKQGPESGTSMNYFDVHDSTWHQMYIDNSGDARAFPPLTGNLVDGKMTLLSEMKDGVQTRWTWYATAPGKVRQMAEQSADAGKTWNISWDSVYVKQTAAKP